MRNLLLVICSLAFVHAQSQSGLRIDTSNYYGYAREGGNINWLRVADAVPVIIEEIRNAGFEADKIQVGQVQRLDKQTVLVVTVAWQGDKPFGFIYEEGHGLPLRKEDRDFLGDDQRESYSQPEYTAPTTVKFQKTGTLPRNIFLLRERCYWFQFDTQGTNYPVNRELAVRILRQDIRAYINRQMARPR
jgi:hypothetical protein